VVVVELGQRVVRVVQVVLEAQAVRSFLLLQQVPWPQVVPEHHRILVVQVLRVVLVVLELVVVVGVGVEVVEVVVVVVVGVGVQRLLHHILLLLLLMG